MIKNRNLPLLLRHLNVDPSSITVVTSQTTGLKQLEASGVNFTLQSLTKANYKEILVPLLSQPGSILVNLSINVSSIALFELAIGERALYWIPVSNLGKADIRTPSERWRIAATTCFARQPSSFAKDRPTAVIAHGANPGLSLPCLVKQALVDVHRDIHGEEIIPQTQKGVELARKLNVVPFILPNATRKLPMFKSKLASS